MQSLCYENQFSFILKLELTIITKFFAHKLTLKERLRGTRKWPILLNIVILCLHMKSFSHFISSALHWLCQISILTVFLFFLHSSSAQSIAHPSYSNHDLPCDFTDACSLIHILGNDISDDDDEESDYSFVPSDSELESFSDESSDQEDHETTPVATTPVTRRRSKGTGCKGSSFLSRTNRKIEEVRK